MVGYIRYGKVWQYDMVKCVKTIRKVWLDGMVRFR